MDVFGSGLFVAGSLQRYLKRESESGRHLKLVKGFVFQALRSLRLLSETSRDLLVGFIAAELHHCHSLVFNVRGHLISFALLD